MDNQNFVEKLAAQFGQNASVKNIFGEPVQVGNKTIIPVAQISYGLGGGYGKGKSKVNPQIESEPSDKGEGAGGGGGMVAKAKGVFEITPAGTRFVPASATKILVTGLVIGFFLRGLFRHRKN